MESASQNGSAFQNGSLEWKCIPEWKCILEWNFGMEGYLRGTKWPLRQSTSEKGKMSVVFLGHKIDLQDTIEAASHMTAYLGLLTYYITQLV